MNALRLALGLMAVLSASAAVGATPDCTPVIESPWVRAAPPGAASLAGYLVLRNPCEAAVEVAGVESKDFGMPMIHRSEVVDGVSRMRAIPQLRIVLIGLKYQLQSIWWHPICTIHVAVL